MNYIMNDILNTIETYETPDFLDLDKLYGFSQACSSGTAESSSCKSPCQAGMSK